KISIIFHFILVAAGFIATISGYMWGGIMLVLFGLNGLVQHYYIPAPAHSDKWYNCLIKNLGLIIAGLGVFWLLANYWMPLGAGKSLLLNVLFVALLVGLILGIFSLIEYYYTFILKWCLNHKTLFLSIPAFLIFLG